MSFCFIYPLYVPNPKVGTLVSMNIPIQQRDSKAPWNLGVSTSVFLTGLGLTYVSVVYLREYMDAHLCLYSYQLFLSGMPSLSFLLASNRDMQIVIKIVFVFSRVRSKFTSLVGFPWYSKLVIWLEMLGPSLFFKGCRQFDNMTRLPSWSKSPTFSWAMTKAGVVY